MTHRELVEDLAEAKSTIYVEVPLGSVWGNPHTQKADVLAVRPSYTRFCVDIFEVKRSRADFKQDDKWPGYLPHCHRLYFAVEAGIAIPKDVPEECGLLVRGDKGWKAVKAARPREVDIPIETLLSVIFYRCKFIQNHSSRMHLARWYSNDERVMLRRLGKDVARVYAEHKDENTTYF